MVQIQYDRANVPIRGWLVMALRAKELIWEQLTLW